MRLRVSETYVTCRFVSDTSFTREAFVSMTATGEPFDTRRTGGGTVRIFLMNGSAPLTLPV